MRGDRKGGQEAGQASPLPPGEDAGDSRRCPTLPGTEQPGCSDRTEPCGFANIYKPIGARSTQVVAAVRRATGARRVGHCGTLDPLAVGVLPVAIGRATKFSQHVLRMRKTYLACVLFGVATATDDLEGAPMGDVRPSPEVADVEAVLPRFVGRIRQRPPTTSAVHVGGRRAYQVVRAGGVPELPEREVTVHAAAPLAHGRLPARVLDGALRFEPGPGARDSLLMGIRIECSSGTYIRSVARDLGETIGCGATLFGLVRAAVGAFTLANATEAWQLALAARHGYLDRLLFPPDAALEELPAQVVGDRLREDLMHGRPVPAPPWVCGLHRIYDADGNLVGVGTAQGGWWQRRRLLGRAA